MHATRGIALLGVTCLLAGCGASAGEQVQAKLQEFAHAVATRDTRTLCRDVLAPGLVNRLTAAGISCRDAMRVFVQSVSDPSISVSRIRVHGSSASAVVLATARGQPAALQTVELVNTAGGWRLASLASPR